jgi:hypothetical protein
VERLRSTTEHVRITGVLPEIRIEHLLNFSLKPYRHGNSLAAVVIKMHVMK